MLYQISVSKNCAAYKEITINTTERVVSSTNPNVMSIVMWCNNSLP